MARNDQIPAVLFYVDDFASDGVVEAMTTEQVGAYILLLCKAWREDPPGSIPDDDDVLARWSRMPAKKWIAARDRVLRAFTRGDDGRWHQKRMQLEFQLAIERSEKGKKAATKRWTGDAKPMLDACSTDAKPMPNRCIPNQTKPNQENPPPSSCSSTVDSRVRRDLEEEVFGCGVEDARRAVSTALDAGCSPEEIKSVVIAWARRNGDLGPGSLHYRLMDLKPGDEPERGWPKPTPEVVAKKHSQKVAEREAAIEAENEKKIRNDDAAAAERERKFGPELDSMDPAEVAEMVKPNPALAKLFRKGPSPLVREWLLIQLERRAKA